MKKIKLVISDLHLGLGRTLEEGQINSLEEFYFDEKFVEFLHYYTTGKYIDYTVELVINGDLLNFLQVPYKGHFLNVITETVSLVKTEGIVNGHPIFFQALRDFCTLEHHQLTMIVGNHDQGLMWPKVRSYLNDVVETNIQFKNLVYFFDGVHIEHGNMHEAANRFDPRKFFIKRNLPEPILNLPFGSNFFIDLVLKIKEKHPHVDKVRPFPTMMRWSLIHETWFTVKASFWLVAYLLKSVFRPEQWKAVSLSSIVKVVLESAVFPDLSEAARRILKDDRVHTVIFGHTHVYQYRQYGPDREYFNTGTWTELTSLDIGSFGRITKLTYVILEYPDEVEPEDVVRPRGRLKAWNGYHRIEEDVAIS